MNRPFSSLSIDLHKNKLYIPTSVRTEEGYGGTYSLHPITCIPIEEIEKLYQEVSKCMALGHPTRPKAELEQMTEKPMLEVTGTKSWRQLYKEMQGAWWLSLNKKNAFIIHDLVRRGSSTWEATSDRMEVFPLGTPVETAVARLIERIRSRAAETI
ncbi:MAG TPA: hypothetical protein VL574_06290 [Stellaceae bacterium]|jgi:hypothetical protein|nr:hypothetical protein [Stellaceae bacterium]